MVDPYRDLSLEEVQDRKKEFTAVLDKNGDGVADKYASYLAVHIK